MNSKQFATVLVITFIVGMIWLGADIWRNTKASVPVSDKLQAALEPVTPTFNNRVLEIINKEVLSKSSVSFSTLPPSSLNLTEADNEVSSSVINEASPAAQTSGGSGNSALPSGQNITPIVTLSPTPTASTTSGRISSP